MLRRHLNVVVFFLQAQYPRLRRFVPVFCLLLLATSPTAAAETIAQLTAEREMLSTELAQYQLTLEVLAGNPSSSATANLQAEVVRIKRRIIAITQREVTLLQQQISRSKREAAATARGDQSYAQISAEALQREEENVARLLALISRYYNELSVSLLTMPSEEELRLRNAAQQDAMHLAKMPFGSDKVRLNGAEGSTALAQITQRLNDPSIAESRRDIAPICSVKTRLYGSLIASENRSLTPVGKHNYIAKVRLQPGETTLRVQRKNYTIKLPDHLDSRDYLLTYFAAGDHSELHVFAVADLLAEEEAHIPPWLPAEFNIGS